jgi:hypothetical protein
MQSCDFESLFNIINSETDADFIKINSLTKQMSEIFIECATQSFPGKAKQENYQQKSYKTPWYGPACFKAKKVYNKARKRYNRHPSEYNRLAYKNSCRIYKNTMNKFLNKYNKSNQDKLRQMHKKQPKDYWKFINKISENKKVDLPNLNSLYEYFESINNNPLHNINDTEYVNDINLNDNDRILNSEITPEEILKSINNLKNGKSPGIDNILNEYIKASKEQMLPIYVSLFNIVLNTGLIPSQWSEGIIIPIYKNKGDPQQPDNYRPITLLSCISKLFTSVLNERLNKFLQHNDILLENQAGFRSDYSTADHIFTLNSLIEILRHYKKKICCIFIDFSQAFDSVWRVGLWKKLLSYNINGKFFQVVRNMYSNIKSCISRDNVKSTFFISNCGVRQGENLSPLLFSLFLNDLESFLISKGHYGIELTDIEDELDTFLRILILLYADDTILISEDPVKLQNCLNDFVEYCNNWKLKINISKTKAIIFGSRNNNNYSFKIGDEQIEIVDSYKYLGTIFSKSGSFLATRLHLTQQAKKAMYLLFKRLNNLNLPVDLALKLFDNTIVPILIYSSEIWGYEDLTLIERVHTDFLRKVTHLRKSTPLYILYAELGRYPLSIVIKSRMINFWNKIITGNQSKISYRIYKYMQQIPNYESKWITGIKNILNETGRFDLWLEQDNIQSKSLKLTIKQILIDQNIQNWHNRLSQSTKGLNYSIFKESIKIEKYLIELKKSEANYFLKFRSSNHFFPCETGRWANIDIADRHCFLCYDPTEVADEFHYLLKCPFFSEPRKTFVKRYYWINPNILKFKELMTLNPSKQLTKLCQFIRILVETVKR